MITLYTLQLQGDKTNFINLLGLIKRKKDFWNYDSSS